MTKWTIVDDNKVLHFWKKALSDDCEYDTGQVGIPPDYYQHNGTPICMCGADMDYSHTEINLD